MNPQTSGRGETVRRIGWSIVFTAGGMLAASPPLAAQTAPPIGGLSGTVALEGTVDQEGAAANTVVVKTADGVRHVFHFTKDLLVHGGKSSDASALTGLRAGTTVAVHYTGTGSSAVAQEIDQVGSDGLKVTEGTVTRIDRGKKEITVRFDDNKTETLQLTDRAAAGTGRDLDETPGNGTRIAVYYTDESGRRVVHFFKKAS